MVLVVKRISCDATNVAFHVQIVAGTLIDFPVVKLASRGSLKAEFQVQALAGTLKLFWSVAQFGQRARFGNERPLVQIQSLRLHPRAVPLAAFLENCFAAVSEPVYDVA